MRVCDRCGGKPVRTVEIAINGRKVDQKELCGQCETELGEFMGNRQEVKHDGPFSRITRRMGMG